MDDPVRKKPAHTSSNQTVGNFAHFAEIQNTKNVHPPPYWDGFDAPPQAPGPHPFPALPCGLYEVDEPGGTTIPIRVRRRADTSKFSPDQFVMEWLLGADKRTWEPFAFVRHDKLEIWKRFTDTDYGLVGRNLFTHMHGGECFDGWEFRLVRPACARCGRELKKDEERAASIHVTCLEKWNELSSP